eukprot:360488-Chlamydomonas_euryale.AAC.4
MARGLGPATGEPAGCINLVRHREAEEMARSEDVGSEPFSRGWREWMAAVANARQWRRREAASSHSLESTGPSG